MLKYLILTIFVAAIPITILTQSSKNNSNPVPVNMQIEPPISDASVPATPKITLSQPPQIKTISNNYHVFQTFNNCGPAALSMALSYYGHNVTQKILGDQLRPYQNPQGNNDDKSVTLEELGEKAREYNLIPFHRPAGNTQLVKYFIANDIPVITRTLLHENEDIGHYRVIKGYDDNSSVFIQDDSLQGKNLSYTYDDFNKLWKQFNYEYLVLVPSEKLEIAHAILRDDVDPKIAWQKAVENSRKQLSQDPNDIYSRFNLSVALYHTKEHEASTKEFALIENRLPLRTLWYQIEPVLAYYQLENFERVFSLTDKIINNHNRAFSELYMIRGEIYLKQQNIIAAKSEFEKAVIYNNSFRSKIPAI